MKFVITEEAIGESCSCCIKWGYPKYYDDEDKQMKEVRYVSSYGIL